MKIAIIGCGDVGRCYGNALAEAGVPASYFCDIQADTAIKRYVSDMDAEFYSEPGPWMQRADVVISAVFGQAALCVLRQSLHHLRKGVLYADFTTANITDLQTSARLSSEIGVDFVDVAILGSISLGGSKTPLLCVGPRAEKLADIMRKINAPTTIINGNPGDAVSLKLLRSIFTKGVEALTIECLMAAERRGLRQELYEVLSDLDRSSIRDLMETLVNTHMKHAGRRLSEVQEARNQLLTEDVHPLVTDGVVALFQRTSNALLKSRFSKDSTIENNLEWLFAHQ